MGTVLFAWEMGGGLGHIGPMKVLAESLTKWGHQPVFVVKDVISARPLLEGLGPILQAPALGRNRTAELAFGAGSFSDIVAIRGFGDPRFLGPAVDAWTDLFELLRPDLLVADFSPTAILAARSRIPIVSVGYGFYLPPDHLPRFPAFRDDIPPVLGDGAILACVRKVLAARGAPLPDTLPAAFRADYTHVYSLPFLDPFAPLRRTPGFGPIESMPEHTDPPAEPAVFAYLAGDHPRIIDVLIALSDLGIRTELYLRDAESSLGRFATRRKLTVHEKPPGFSETMSRTSLVVSHGGGGITHAALLSGRPQIVIPRQTESYGTAIAIEKLNMGRRVMAEHGANAIRAAIAHASGNPALRKNAEALARSAHENFYLQARLQGLLEACNELAYASHGSRRQSKPQRLTSIA